MVSDMNGQVIKVGDVVRKHSIVNDDSSSYKVAEVRHILPMHEGGDLMVWAGGGGAHHPKACVVLNDAPYTDAHSHDYRG